MTQAALRPTPRLRAGRRARATGFTLVELMVTLAIAAILATVAVPSMRDFITAQRVKSATYDLSYALTFARSEAIKRNSPVVLAPQNGAWQNGWTVSWTTTPPGGTTRTDVLNRHEATPDLVLAGSANSLTYNSSGRLTADETWFDIRDSRDVGSTTPRVQPRCLRVSLNGLPTTTSGAC